MFEFKFRHFETMTMYLYLYQTTCKEIHVVFGIWDGVYVPVKEIFRRISGHKLVTELENLETP